MSYKSIRWVLGDQLHTNITSLKDTKPDKDIIFMCEVQHEATVVKHHQKKLVLIFSAMRHFAQSLEEQGYKVVYIKMDDPNNTGSFEKECLRISKKHPQLPIIVTEPSEYRVLELIKSLQQNIAIEIRSDDRFFCSKEEFKIWAGTKKQLRMENFYRKMRVDHHILMDESGKPIGGQWNYDKENRKSPPKNGLDVPSPTAFTPDEITDEVIQMVATRFGDHFGNTTNFHYAVTRSHALKVLKDFIQQRIKLFGDYQDAMLVDEFWMYHAHIGFYLNTGLLEARECVQAACDAYTKHTAPLSAVEGFVRQILGWREFMRGIYWLKMPEYTELNFLKAKEALPDFYWTGKTDMKCMQQAIKATHDQAYAHHIQRLMVTGNYALLTGIDPKSINEWYWIVYADAYHWVELPNVYGMAIFADGGVYASKPYAASGAYINKMSNYCKNCRYHVDQKFGDDACPFNYLYWYFLHQNESTLKNNNRMSLIYALLAKNKNLDAIISSAKKHIATHHSQKR